MIATAPDLKMATPAAGSRPIGMEREQASKFLHDLLKLMLSKRGSDLFLTAEFPPAFKIDGKLMPVSNVPLTPQHTVELARALMNDRQAGEFEAKKELNFAISPTGIGRFRVRGRPMRNQKEIRHHLRIR